MSNNYVDDDFDSEDEDSSPASLRRAANQAKKLRREVDGLRRELAFAKAGLPMNDPKMSYFIKGYDGDLDAEAIKEAAEAAGFLEIQQSQAAQEKAPEPQQIAQQALAGQDRVIAAAAGAVAEDVTEAAAFARMEQAMQEGGIEALMDVARAYGMPTAYDG